MDKFYKVIKENPLWEVGAILKHCAGGYRPDNDIWNVNEFIQTEYISERIVENSPEYFQKVYEVNLLTEIVYKTKEEAKIILNKEFSD